MRLIMLKLLRPAVGYDYTCVSCVRRAASFGPRSENKSTRRKRRACAIRTKGHVEHEEEECDHGSCSELPGSSRQDEDEDRSHQQPVDLLPFRTFATQQVKVHV